eukprot:5617817-Pleurochrysis_carterae.AAC.2
MATHHEIGLNAIDSVADAAKRVRLHQVQRILNGRNVARCVGELSILWLRGCMYMERVRRHWPVKVKCAPTRARQRGMRLGCLAATKARCSA